MDRPKIGTLVRVKDADFIVRSWQGQLCLVAEEPDDFFNNDGEWVYLRRLADGHAGGVRLRVIQHPEEQTDGDQEA